MWRGGARPAPRPIRKPAQADASAFGVEVVPIKAIDARDARSVTRSVSTLRGEEGVVAWCERGDGSYLLSKFKSEWYLKAHALASFATFDRVRDYVWSNSIESPEGFVECLMRDG